MKPLGNSDTRLGVGRVCMAHTILVRRDGTLCTVRKDVAASQPTSAADACRRRGGVHKEAKVLRQSSS